MQAFTTDVGGKLESADVEATIDKSGDKLRACISVDTVISLKMKVLASGTVGDVQVPSAVPNDPKVRDCVTAALRKLVFPKPKGTEPASLAMNLDLRKQVAQ